LRDDNPRCAPPPGRQEADPAAERLRRELSSIPRLLLIRLRSLGDSILSLPLVQALHEWRPDLRMDVLIESAFAPVFENHPAVAEVLVVKSGAAGEGRSRAGTALELRRRRYPAVMNLHGGTTSLWFTLAGGSPVRIGQEGFRGARCYNRRIPPSCRIWQSREIHTVEHQLTLMLWLGLPVPERPRPRLHVDAQARERIRRLLVALGVAPGTFVLVHPTATLPTKQWPEDRFAALADRLDEAHKRTVVFVAAPWEAGVLEAIARQARRRHCYLSDLALRDLFALIEICRLYVGNDSGPLHAAAALGRPVVAVWGSSDHRAWHPWDTPYESVRSDLPCMPCPGYSCAAFDRPRCIQDIPVERVAEACARMLAASEGGVPFGP